MTDDTIHTCSYSCERPGCIRAQRDELVAKVEALWAEVEAWKESFCQAASRAERLAEALEAIAQQPAAPSGEAVGDWALVPRTPTDAMLRAAQSAWLDDTLRRTTTMWRAMLAAAPQPPAAVDGPDAQAAENARLRECEK
jgi:hypothetical protein